MAEKLLLAPAARREFLKLVDAINSRNGGERVIGRLQMTGFIRKHGKEACDQFYAAYTARLNARAKK